MADQNRSRVKFSRGEQRLFIDNISRRLNLGWDTISKIFNIKRRTLSDWRREKFTMSHSALLNLCKNYNMPMPRKVRILSSFWHVNKAAKLGGLSRNKFYGNLGTPEGRRKGGLTTIGKFMADPGLAKKLGLRIKKEIKCPKRGLQLAEFVGVVLGDGGLTDYQLKITFNRDTDAAYADFLQELIKRLFKLTPRIISKKLDKGSDITIYSKSLVEFLESNGLKRGNKIKNKADIPFWIKQNNNFQLSCLRGLMDTDGSFYSYHNTASGNRYSNFALCFTNHSRSLLSSVYNILQANKLGPTEAKERVYIYKKESIKRYFEIVGSHNPKHFEKYQNAMEGLESG